MNYGTENILQQFWGSRELDQVTIEEIETTCAKYPYFAPLQLLLAQKYKRQQHASYASQAAKASVYFNNWYWLNELLENRVVLPVTKAVVPEQNINEATTLELTLETEDYVGEKELVTESAELAAVTADDITVESEIKEDIINPLAETQSSVIESNIHKEGLTSSPDSFDENNEDFTIITTQPSAELNEDPVEPETFLEPQLYSTETVGEKLTDETDNKPTAFVSTAAAKNDGEQEEGEEEPFIDHQKEPTTLPGIAEIKQNISLLKNALSDLSTGSAPVIPIEPLHTIDYFASQGIKLKDLGIDPKDQLGQKLKSFTEWLKTMKKLHPEKLEAKIDEKAQSSIQHMAEHSNTTGDVLTESIAEVYARQGLKEKAREVYLKLSLHNPGKSAYFAAKISNLNDL